ncbi:MAG: hypothetical protein WCO11_11100 [Sphingomonadales bacterium]|jgi:hypothetical protein
MLTRTILTSLTSLAALGASSAALAQNQQIQLLVGVEVPAPKTSGAGLMEAQDRARAEAARAAWAQVRARPDIRGKVTRLTPADDETMAQYLATACTATPLDSQIDKKLKTLAARFRLDCNQKGIQDRINALVGPGIPIKRLATFFLVKEVAGRTEYDPSIVRTNGQAGSFSAAASASSTSKSQSDQRSKNESREGWREGRGGIDESMQERNQTKGQESASASARMNLETNASVTTSSSGKTTRTAMTQTYRNASPEEFNASLANVFSREGLKITNYADIFAAGCGGPSPDPDKLARDYGDKADDLPSAVRNAIFKKVKECGIEYILIGWAELDGSVASSVTGYPKVSVNTRAKVYFLGDMIPEEIPVDPKGGDASSENPNTARMNAVNEAAERVAEELISRLTARAAEQGSNR